MACVDPASDLHHYQRLIASAAAAFPNWSSTTSQYRAGQLIALSQVIKAWSDTFCDLTIREIGTTRTWAEHNVEFAVEMLEAVASYADEVDRVEILPDEAGVISRAERSACGVCLGIAPWNAPLILGIRAIAAPLLCGNTVLLKGNEIAPQTFRLLGDAIRESEFPEGVAQVFLTRSQDSESIVEALIKSPVVRRVNFTGSTRVGRRVAELCARHLKRSLLELGGQASMIVLEDADLEAAAEAALRGAYLNQGQICMSTERLIVADAIADELIARIEAGRQQLVVGNPEAPDTQIGPVISVGAADRLSGLISDAVSKGAILVGGGSIHDAFVDPTLLDRVEPDMRVYNEEVFGPLLSITRVANEQEAISIANDSEYGLAAAIFSRDVSRALAIAGKLHSGICHINRATVDDNPHAPFGGVKSSGYGRFGGRWALHEFTELRWITLSESDNNRA